MLNPDYIPDSVLTDLLESKSLPDDESGYEAISTLTAEQAFSAWLEYNGIIGFYGRIVTALDGLRKAEQLAAR